MIKVLIFIALVFALGLGFAYIAEMPGEVAVTVGDQLITVSLMVAAIGVVAIVGLIMLAWWLVRVLFTSPQRMQRFFRARRRDRGYQSLSTGIIAAGAGDAATSRRMLQQAGGLLNETTEPLIQLLDAQTTLLEGKHKEARTKFEAMLEDPELRMLGMRGLYMEAQRLGDREAQRHYAEKAAELAPQLTWAGKAAIDLKTATGDWDGAIRLIDQQKTSKQISKEDAARKRAVLLTALAMAISEADPTRAKQSALEAHRLQPDFAPAAVAAAEAAFRLGEMRRGIKVLETCWRKAPHPEVALAYVNARPGDSALDRLARARRLEQLKPNNAESALIVAQMALEAGEFEQARKAIAFILRNAPRESAFMLMADIEDAETGDQGKVREWLSRAVRAPRDPAWTADGYVAEKWAPFSPVTGLIDALEWKVPVERAAPLIENDLDPMQPGTPADQRVDKVPEDMTPMLPAAAAAAPVIDEEPVAVRAPRKPVDLAERVEVAKRERETEEEAHLGDEMAQEIVPASTAAPEPEAPDAAITEPEPAGADESGADEAETADAPIAEQDNKPAAEPGANGKADRDLVPDATDVEREAAKAEEKAEPAEAKVEEAAKPSADTTAPDNADRKADADAVNPPLPDDPGIDPDAPQDEQPRRFRLF